jgi:uncharacterized membrane protein YagU involved in acid resistance
MPDLVRSVLAGSAAGCVATAPMTAVMEGVRRLLPPDQQDPLPPRQITERAADAVGLADDLTEDQKEAATAAAHFGFGATAGAAYGLVAPHLPFGPVGNGVGYGLAVWAGSYFGWLPATGLYKEPENEPAGRHLKMAVSHVVWGVTLGLIHHALAGDGRSEDRSGWRPGTRTDALAMAGG